jgi:hypothetical protein
MPSKRIPEHYHKLSHHSFLSHPLQFIIHYPAIRDYIV